MESALYLFMLFCLINLSQALYFHISETERKCFIEEIPDETMVVGKYKCQLFDPNTGGYMPSSPGIGVSTASRVFPLGTLPIKRSLLELSSMRLQFD